MDFDDTPVNVLLEDEDFRQWVWNPKPETDIFWKNWGNGNPQRIEAINITRLILLSIDVQNYQGRKEDYQKLFNRIKLSIQLIDVDSFWQIPEVKETGSKNNKKKE